jgi:hypothetical protein
MKIVDCKTFLALPPGTVYAKYAPSYFEGLCIKGDTLPNGNDWFYQQIVDSIRASDSGEWGALLDESETTGRELVMDFNFEGRDGCFEDDQLFAVWSKEDVAQLIERLKRCL